jgi:hypothetical protein
MVEHGVDSAEKHTAAQGLFWPSHTGGLLGVFSTEVCDSLFFTRSTGEPGA